MKKIFPKHDSDTIIEMLDQYEEVSYKVAKLFFDDHNFQEESHRLDEGRYIGVGTHRILMRICLDCFDGSLDKLINFYARCNRKHELPHYEDLTTILITSLISVFLATVAAEAGKKAWKDLLAFIQKKSEAKSIKTKLGNTFEGPIAYLFLATALRQQFQRSMDDDGWEYHIDEDEYLLLLRNLHEHLNRVADNIFEKEITSKNTMEKFHGFRKDYLRQHNVDSDNLFDSLMNDIEMLLNKAFRDNHKR